MRYSCACRLKINPLHPLTLWSRLLRVCVTLLLLAKSDTHLTRSFHYMALACLSNSWLMLKQVETYHTTVLFYVLYGCLMIKGHKSPEKTREARRVKYKQHIVLLTYFLATLHKPFFLRITFYAYEPSTHYIRRLLLLLFSPSIFKFPAFLLLT